jgi:hypothetical protein
VVVKIDDAQRRGFALRLRRISLRKHRAGRKARSQCAEKIAPADRRKSVARHHEVLPVPTLIVSCLRHAVTCMAAGQDCPRLV